MYVKSTNQKMKIPKPNIIWSHKHRNELYHDGKGMVPEERILKGIRAAAFYVFSTLFNIDVEDLLKTPPMLNKPNRLNQQNNETMNSMQAILKRGSSILILTIGLLGLVIGFGFYNAPKFISSNSII